MAAPGSFFPVIGSTWVGDIFRPDGIFLADILFANIVLVIPSSYRHPDTGATVDCYEIYYYDPNRLRDVVVKFDKTDLGADIAAVLVLFNDYAPTGVVFTHYNDLLQINYRDVSLRDVLINDKYTRYRQYRTGAAQTDISVDMGGEINNKIFTLTGDQSTSGAINNFVFVLNSVEPGCDDDTKILAINYDYAGTGVLELEYRNDVTGVTWTKFSPPILITGGGVEIDVAGLDIDALPTPVAEVDATATVTITGGTASAGVNKITQVTVDGVSTLSAAVDWVTSHPATATALAAAITAGPSDYTAAAVGAVVTLTAAADGAGATVNGDVVAVTVGGNVTATKTNVAGGVTEVSGDTEFRLVDGDANTTAGVDTTIVSCS